MGVGRKGKSEGESEPETQCAIERQSFGITTQITVYYLPPLNNAYTCRMQDEARPGC